MRSKHFILVCGLFMLALFSCNSEIEGYKNITSEVLKDKIGGGWSGKMIGVTYGAPTEFRAQGKIYTDSIKWKPEDVKGSIWHKFGLPAGQHKVRIEVKGEKRTDSEGTKINLLDALVFKTAQKKNVNFNFSFQ